MDALKAACLAVAQEALKPPHLFDPYGAKITSNLAHIAEILQREKQISPSVAEYVFFPIRSLLQQDRLGDRAVELIFTIVTVLCQKSWNNKTFQLERAQQLVAVTSFLLSPEPPIASSPATAEPSASFFKKPASYRAAGYGCFAAVFHASVKAGFADQLGRSPAIAEIIAILLNGIQYDSESLDAQLHSIDALHVIYTDVVANRDHRALVLPKVVSKLTKFINVANKRHFSAKVAALDCLKDVLLGCITAEKDSAVMTSEWLETTMTNLVHTFTVIQKLQASLLELSGSRPELISAIYEFAQSVYNLPLSEKCKDIIMETLLLSSSQSVSPTTALEAQKFLQQNDTKAVLETSLIQQLDQLPQLLTTPNESHSVLGMLSLQTTLKLLGDTDSCMAVIEAIEYSFPLSVTRGAVKAQSVQNGLTVKAIDGYQTNSKYISLASLGLKLEMADSAQDSLVALLYEVGQKAGKSLIPALSEKLREMKTATKSLNAITLLWILGAVLRGAGSVDVYDVVTYCYDDLAAGLDMQTSGHNLSPVSIAHTALCCSLIGEAALVEGDQFKEFLVDLIHPLFSMLGNFDSLAVREQAGLAIAKVAYACGYPSPTELAVDNRDYLVDGISFQLNTLNMTPGTFQALASLIYISGGGIVPYLDDLFASLFVLLDKYHGYTALLKGVLNVFGALTMVIARTTKLPKLIGNGSGVRFNTFDDLVAELERKPEIDPSILEKEVDLDNFAKPKKEDDVEEDDEDDEDIKDEPDQAVEKWEFPIPKPTYEILSKIAGYCDRLMTHESADIRMATLMLVTPLIPFLAVNKDLFLPLVHKTWPEAIARAFDSESFVVEQAILCLNAIAENARDFVSSRIDQLWPKLASKYALVVAKKWPQFSPERRIANSLASFLNTVIENVNDISLVTMESALAVFRPALLRGEHLHLKDSIQSNRSLSDLMWLVTLDEQCCRNGMHTIYPVYKSM